MPGPPSRHDRLAAETGGWRKKWTGLLPVALVFPNLYRVGMSNLGFQLVYDLVNSQPELVCERVFLPETPGRPLSVESNRPLRDFPLILCSLSFEEDYLNLIRMLDAGGIEPLAENRRTADPFREPGRPLLVGGGVATFINPEPLAPFFDLLVIGEAEAALPPVLAALLAAGGRLDRPAFLRSLAASSPGCYAPQLYSCEYGPQGELLGITAPSDLPARVRKVTGPKPAVAGHSRVLTPEAEFADLFLAELGRGCSRGCRFCAAGFVYRPPRLWEVAAIKAALAARPQAVRRIGLLGMEMARRADLAALSDYLLGEECALSFSSLRADAISPELLRLLAASGLKSAAIAPDGGSERLRRVINKGLTEEDLLRAAEALAEVGIANLKLYCMIGLPTEEDEDLLELVALARRIKDKVMTVGRRRGRVADLTLSVNCLVPKAWTPFQFYGMPPVLELKRKLKLVRKGLAGEPNIRIQAEPPEKALLQAVLARGDRRLGAALPAVVRSEKNWRQAMKDEGLDPGFYANRGRGEQERFPWEIVDHGLDRGYLWREYQRALAARATPPCEIERCRRCGVCG
ncbi:MAG: radical SAM protein [Desulfobacteraceae bacterium]|nr:radical SAM protein [Desulfobacteraceae bacterium]